MNVSDKRAALELHKLAPLDREWVLGRLPPAEQARVRPLLAELDGMKIRFDLETDAYPANGDPDAGAASAASATAGFSPRTVIRDASFADVLRVLASEPAWLARAILAIDAWPWSAAICAALAEKGVLRQQQSARQNDPRLPPGLAAALLPLFAERLRGSPGVRLNGHSNSHRNGVNGIGVWGRVWPKVKQWLP